MIDSRFKYLRCTYHEFTSLIDLCLRITTKHTSALIYFIYFICYIIALSHIADCRELKKNTINFKVYKSHEIFFLKKKREVDNCSTIHKLHRLPKSLL